MAFFRSRLVIVLIGLAVVSSIVTGAVHPGAATASFLPQDSGDVRRVSPEEVRTLLKEGKAVLVDVRGTGAYNAGHVKGALDIAVGDIAQRANELPKNKMILTYCS